MLGLGLENKTVIVTGAARGIGQYYCLGFAQAGANVMAADIIDVEDTLQKIASTGSKAQGVKVDVTSFASCAQMVDKTVQQFGHVDILVNNAALYGGLKGYGSFMDIAEEEWDQVMQINVKGVWNCVKAVTPVMSKAQYGKIVNISSATILMGIPGILHYVTSKGAIFAMTRSLSRELGPLGIRVNTLAPGLTMSQASKDLLSAAGMGDAITQQLASQAALGREEQPEDLVGTALFLASPLSDFMTGQMVNVDGGLINW
jgi:NAD(P)-dependent dehydrogenase (short-subunit alcohol dehydrogenase family)